MLPPVADPVAVGPLAMRHGAAVPAAAVAVAAARAEAVRLLEPRPATRVDKLLAEAGLVPRRYARPFCRNWDVRGIVVGTDGGHSLAAITTGATRLQPGTLLIDGAPVEYASVARYLAFHKPAGVVCTHADDEGETVYDRLPRMLTLRKPPLATVGRLDKGATGLLLMMADGRLASQLTRPGAGCGKTYVVALAAPLSEGIDSTGRRVRGTVEAAAFASGKIELADGTMAQPALLRPHATHANVAEVTLYEGRYHQLRRMFATVGHEVVALHRSSFAGLTLRQLGLQEGEWRLLNADELATVILSARYGTEAALRMAGGGDGADSLAGRGVGVGAPRATTTRGPLRRPLAALRGQPAAAATALR